MPGTVQVSILELSGLPSSKTIKVSLGKHTCEGEGANVDFLLPLATLRDNLVVKVHDAEGNEIAHTGVKTRLIAEKGCWDDLFPLEGGGQVHMRLKFSLSEEERNRIRNMRESALKKKQEELLIKNKKDLQAEIAVASSGEASSKPGTSSASIQVKEKDQINNLKEQSTLEKPPSNVEEDDPSYNLKEQSQLPKIPSKVQEDDPLYNSLEKAPSKRKKGDERCNLKELSPLEKTPSKVREAVAAFESSLPPQRWMATTKEESRTEITDAHLKEETSESISAQSVESLEGPFSKRLQEHPTSTREETGPIENRGSLYEPNHLKDPNDRRRRCSCHNFDGWIFLEEAMCSCIASDNRMLVGEFTSSKGDKRTGVTKKPEPSHSSGGGSSKGPNGQVMKIVIMVGFGLLVLFTRKSKSR